MARNAATIRHMVERQARILYDLMDLSRLQTDKLTLSQTRVNLSETVSHVISLMAADAREKGISVFLEGASKELIVHGDVVRLKQIAWNLLSNPLKFTPAGGKAWVRLAEEGEMAHIEVADSGKGIASEHLPVIFKLFRQGDTGTTRKYGGTGIGLALVRELTRSHGGRVGATSEGEGRGAQFHVWLPLAAGHHGATDMMPEVQTSLAGKRRSLCADHFRHRHAGHGWLHPAGGIARSCGYGLDAGDRAFRLHPAARCAAGAGRRLRDPCVQADRAGAIPAHGKPHCEMTERLSSPGFEFPVRMSTWLSHGWRCPPASHIAFDPAQASSGGRRCACRFLSDNEVVTLTGDISRKCSGRYDVVL
ncbi:sensor histidine kinase [Noviherbaspirillum pedocola]|uniref:histidine kinase n=1 Tax=Noviherbaspirillum pedocola TaxID=2801341 RepID=A0A934T119_9BURK|nr:HAMP domain-containing sensor histidine kinase [Noviherbaspirillum pedocola]MBK4736907.1 HAMP domain-containing histidine kinase [Noviherbaspirillum pedocola]